MTLVFDISATALGFDASFVESVGVLPDLVFMPGMPECFAGVCSARGDIVPVVDLARILDIAHSGEYACAITLRINDLKFAVMADKVVKSVRDNPPSDGQDASDKLLYAFLPDNTAIVNVACLVRTILQSAEGTI